MRTTAVAVSIALLALTAACGGDGQTSGAVQTAPAEQPASAPAAAPSAEGGEQTSAQVLTGVVGEPDNPDAFTIALTDGSGEPVETVPAGEYQVRVTDLSEIHNFHLTGPDVDESTTVPETGETVWEVTLEPGDYTFVCDPHPSMSGAFTVT